MSRLAPPRCATMLGSASTASRASRATASTGANRQRIAVIPSAIAIATNGVLIVR